MVVCAPEHELPPAVKGPTPMTPDAIEHHTLDRESAVADLAQQAAQVARRRRLMWIAGLAVLIAIVIWVIHHRLASQADQPSFAAMMGPLPVSVDKVSTTDVPVVIEEFSDFQCPPCKTLSEKLKRIEGEYGSQIKIVYRQYPLASHKNALAAALAAPSTASGVSASSQ